MSKKVFISYDHSEDAHYKDLLRAWNSNDAFEFEFDQRSPNVPINSSEANVIQGALTKKMKESAYILVIIGKKSHTSKWMKWEINRAKQPDLKLKFAAIKIEETYVEPEGLPFPATSFAKGFTHDGIIKALAQARNSY